MPPTTAKRRKATGQPRNFDRGRALENAMKLFWERGYEGTSMDEIFEAMELSPSSFYNTFGSKEALYQELVTFYFGGAGSFYSRALARGRDTREAFRMLLDDTAEAFTSPTLPHGCFISLAATHIGPSLESVRVAMTEHRLRAERALVARIKQGIADGDMPADTDAHELAAYFDAIFRGMAVKARDGASRKQLMKLGARAMKAWPA
jgi:AcrR family transcriptional regulator